MVQFRRRNMKCSGHEYVKGYEELCRYAAYSRTSSGLTPPKSKRRRNGSIGVMVS